MLAAHRYKYFDSVALLCSHENVHVCKSVFFFSTICLLIENLHFFFNEQGVETSGPAKAADVVADRRRAKALKV